MRPQPIILFERAYLASILFGIASVALSWQQLRAIVPAGILIGVSVVMLALLVALVLLVSRRRSLVAKWLLVLLTLFDAAISLPAVPRSLAAGPVGWLGLLQGLLQIVAVALLFTAPARAWLADKGAGDAA